MQIVMKMQKAVLWTIIPGNAFKLLFPKKSSSTFLWMN